MTDKGPLLGIFYLVHGRLELETTPMNQVPARGGIKAHTRRHYDMWVDLQAEDTALRGMDCYALPRGRVSYREDVHRFALLADVYILKESHLVAHIIAAMRLPETLLSIKGDEHYQCAACKKAEKTYRMD
jgi:hypothetical protein